MADAIYVENELKPKELKRIAQATSVYTKVGLDIHNHDQGRKCNQGCYIEKVISHE
jgi:hypothetical protein